MSTTTSEPLSLKRARFTQAVAQLILQGKAIGVHVALNECKRSDEQAEINAAGEAGRAAIAKLLEGHGWDPLARAILNNGKANGIRNSLHEDGLAVDLIIYSPGPEMQYVSRDTADFKPYQQLGEWWEQTYKPDAAWGGRFNDPGHFSFQAWGRK